MTLLETKLSFQIHAYNSSALTIALTVLTTSEARNVQVFVSQFAVVFPLYYLNRLFFATPSCPVNVCGQ